MRYLGPSSNTVGTDSLYFESTGDIIGLSGISAQPAKCLSNHSGAADAGAKASATFKKCCRVADFLAKHPALILVNYPRLQQGVAARRVQDYLQGGYGELVGFELAGGRKAGRAFINVLAFFYKVANIGDARSLEIHPASTAHSQHSAEEQG